MKAGVALAEIAPKANRQVTRFDNRHDIEGRKRLDQTTEQLNDRLGRGALQLAAAERRKAWAMKRERFSPC